MLSALKTNGGPRTTELSAPIVYGWPPLSVADRIGLARCAGDRAVDEVGCRRIREVAEVGHVPECELRRGARLDVALHADRGAEAGHRDLADEVLLRDDLAAATMPTVVGATMTLRSGCAVISACACWVLIGRVVVAVDHVDQLEAGVLRILEGRPASRRSRRSGWSRSARRRGRRSRRCSCGARSHAICARPAPMPLVSAWLTKTLYAPDSRAGVVADHLDARGHRLLECRRDRGGVVGGDQDRLGALGRSPSG